MSAQIVPFVFKDNLVRTVEREGEPWFVGPDVAKALGHRDASNALRSLDEDEKGTHNVSTPGGEQTMIIVSEPGCYRLIFTSRKAEAEEFKRWLAHEVLPQLRKTGKFAPEALEPPLAFGDDRAVAQLNAQLAVVKEARLLFGSARAAALWSVLGLPDTVGAGQGTPIARSGAKCLAHLLACIEPKSGCALRTMIEDAINLDEFEGARDIVYLGLRVDQDEPQGVLVANGHGELWKLFSGTPWAEGRWAMALKRLPGAHSVGATRFADRTHRAVWIPAEIVLDAALAG